jgi:hypothetical protein
MAAATWFPALGGEHTMTSNVLKLMTLSLWRRLLMCWVQHLSMCVLVRKNCLKKLHDTEFMLLKTEF